MDPDLMHSPGDRTALYQGMQSIGSQRGKIRLGRLPFPFTYFDHAVILLQNRGVDQLVIEVMNAVNDRVVELGDLPLFKLDTEVTISLRIFGDGQGTGCFFIESVTHLGIGNMLTRQAEQVYLICAVFQRGQERGFIDDDKVGIFKENDLVKLNSGKLQGVLVLLTHPAAPCCLA